MTPAIGTQAKLPNTDWLLLPVLGLLTIFLLIGCLKGVAEREFSILPLSMLAPCFIMNDRATGIRAVHNSTCIGKLPESKLVRYTFNGCGHRMVVECGPKPAGVYRIVAVGSSFGYGAQVQSEESFPALLPAELTRETGRKIEVYNESMFGGWPRTIPLRFHEVISAQPDMILWTFTPSDIQLASLVLWSDHVAVTLPESVIEAGFVARTLYRVRTAFSIQPVPEAIAYLWNYEISVFRGSVSGILLQDILYSSQHRYVKSYLNGPDAEVGYLRADPSPAWRENLREFESDVAEVETLAAAAGVPLVAALLPARAQTAMISVGSWPQGLDPYRLDDELQTIITRHGGTYLDILPDLRGKPNPESGYFPVDGHPNVHGHAMLSDLLADKLAHNSLPGLHAARK